MSVIDKYCKPMILQGSLSEESVYRNCLKYAKIIFSDELEWNILYNDARRAELHTSIAKYCDCSEDLVSSSLDEAFIDRELHYPHSVDDRFLKCVDRWFDKLKDIARLPEEERFPSLIPKDCEISEDLGMPNTGVEVKNEQETNQGHD